MTKSTRLCTLTGRTASSRDFERRRSETQARQVGSLDMELRSHDSRTVSPGSAGDEPNLVPACRCVTPVNPSRGPHVRFLPRALLSPLLVIPRGPLAPFHFRRERIDAVLKGSLRSGLHSRLIERLISNSLALSAMPRQGRSTRYSRSSVAASVSYRDRDGRFFSFFRRGHTCGQL